MGDRLCGWWRGASGMKRSRAWSVSGVTRTGAVSLRLDEPAFSTRIASLHSAIAVDHDSKRETSAKSLVLLKARLELTKFSRQVARTWLDARIARVSAFKRAAPVIVALTSGRKAR